MKRNQTSVQNVSAYERSVHLQGRVWDSMALALMLMAPAAICIYFDAWPPLTAVLKALLGVAPMYWTVGVIEVLTFVPMLVQTVCFWGVGLLGGGWLCYRWTPPLGVAGFWLAAVLSLILAAALLLPLLLKAVQATELTP